MLEWVNVEWEDFEWELGVAAGYNILELTPFLKNQQRAGYMPADTVRKWAEILDQAQESLLLSVMA